MKYVLLVEDSRLLQERVLESLSDFSDGLVTHIAPTAHDAIALVNQHRFDLIIADIELAQGNGFEVIEHTQTKAQVAQKPLIIILSNHVNRHYRQLADRLEIDYFFDKSMQYEDAMQVVTQFMKGSSVV